MYVCVRNGRIVGIVYILQGGGKYWCLQGKMYNYIFKILNYIFSIFCQLCYLINDFYFNNFLLGRYVFGVYLYNFNKY